MDSKTKKRTKMHHVITLTFCYFPFAWLVNLWVMRAVQMDCKEIVKLILPLMVETIVFVTVTHFFNDMKKLEQLMYAIGTVCPRILTPSANSTVKELRKSLYIIRAIIVGSLIATLPWENKMMGTIPLLCYSGIIWLEVIMQDMYYLIVYYKMFGNQ